MGGKWEWSQPGREIRMPIGWDAAAAAPRLPGGAEAGIETSNRAPGHPNFVNQLFTAPSELSLECRASECWDERLDCSRMDSWNERNSGRAAPK